MRRGLQLAVAIALGLGWIAVPAHDASAAGSCSLIGQSPYRTEIGNTNTYLLHFPVALACSNAILSSTARGTVKRENTAYFAFTDEKANQGLFTIHNSATTACSPGTQYTYTSSIGAVVVTAGGGTFNLAPINMSASINCALF